MLDVTLYYVLYLQRCFTLKPNQWETKTNQKRYDLPDQNVAQVKPGGDVKVEHLRPLDDDEGLQRGRRSAQQHDPLQREDEPQQDGESVEVEHLVEYEVAAQAGGCQKFARNVKEDNNLKLR